MPCDIGYKNFTPVTIPAPAPLRFKKNVAAPQVDAELLALIGQEDNTFLQWMNGLDITPLLEQALKDALAASGRTGPVAFRIEDGQLAATATLPGGTSSANAERIADQVGRRWQMEVLSIVAQLLDFETEIEVSGNVITLRGEKRGNSPVTEFIRVTVDPARGASVEFEHFASKKELDLVRAKFAALSQKLGVPLKFGPSREGGNPIPAGHTHRHHLKKGGK